MTDVILTSGNCAIDSMLQAGPVFAVALPSSDASSGATSQPMRNVADNMIARKAIVHRIGRPLFRFEVNMIYRLASEGNTEVRVKLSILRKLGGISWLLLGEITH
jgi:hypothetical protein